MIQCNGLGRGWGRYAERIAHRPEDITAMLLESSGEHLFVAFLWLAQVHVACEFKTEVRNSPEIRFRFQAAIHAEVVAAEVHPKCTLIAPSSNGFEIQAVNARRLPVSRQPLCLFVRRPTRYIFADKLKTYERTGRMPKDAYG